MWAHITRGTSVEWLCCSETVLQPCLGWERVEDTQETKEITFVIDKQMQKNKLMMSPNWIFYCLWFMLAVPVFFGEKKKSLKLTGKWLMMLLFSWVSLTCWHNFSPSEYNQSVTLIYLFFASMLTLFDLQILIYKTTGWVIHTTIKKIKQPLLIH